MNAFTEAERARLDDLLDRDGLSDEEFAEASALIDREHAELDRTLKGVLQ